MYVRTVSDSINIFSTVGIKKGLGKERGILSEAQHRAYLDRHPYKEYQQEELDIAR
jgi:hypothetical protein